MQQFQVTLALDNYWSLAGDDDRKLSQKLQEVCVCDAVGIPEVDHNSIAKIPAWINLFWVWAII